MATEWSPESPWPRGPGRPRWGPGPGGWGQGGLQGGGRWSAVPSEERGAHPGALRRGAGGRNGTHLTRQLRVSEPGRGSRGQCLLIQRMSGRGAVPWEGEPWRRAVTPPALGRSPPAGLAGVSGDPGLPGTPGF